MEPTVIETPDLDHITYEDYDHVYEPSDDSFLFLDALEKEYQKIKEIDPVIITEIGPGSGILSTALTKTLNKEGKVLTFGVDINLYAAKITKSTYSHNQIQYGEVIVSDLFRCFGNRLCNQMDIILFNPPYVPSSDEELLSNDIEAAWAGGKDGRVIIDQFIPYIPYMLSEKGRLYLLLERANKPEEVMNIFKSMNLHTYVVLEKRRFNEVLCVIVVYKN